MSGPDWFVEAFRADYLELYPHRDRADAARGVAFVRRVLETLGDPSALLLDCGCGAGRHVGPLREVGFAAVGIDLSLDLLRRGAEDHGRDGAAFPVARADMRALPFCNAAFGAALSLFTSFGYFADGNDDRRALAEIARVLRAGGLFLIDFLNAAYVRAHLVPRSERELPGGQRLVEERRIDEATNRVVKRVQRGWPDGRRREWTESVRLYDAVAMDAMLTVAGLTPLERHGDFDRAPYDDRSPRLIVLARKAR